MKPVKAKGTLYDGKGFIHDGELYTPKSAKEREQLLADGNATEPDGTEPKAPTPQKSDEELLGEEELGKLKLPELKRLCELLEIDGLDGFSELTKKPDFIVFIEANTDSEILEYDTDTNYEVDDEAITQNPETVWIARQANGPDTTVVAPGTDDEFWIVGGDDED